MEQERPWVRLPTAERADDLAGPRPAGTAGTQRRELGHYPASLFPPQSQLAGLLDSLGGSPSPANHSTRGNATLNPLTGEHLESTQVRATSNGELYEMHYHLHYMDLLLAYYLVGICTLLMFMAIITGRAHRRSSRTSSPDPARQRSWLDAQRDQRDSPAFLHHDRWWCSSTPTCPPAWLL